MDLQKHNQGLIQQPDTILVKVPEPLYQIWYDMILGMIQLGKPLHIRQKKIFERLQLWVQEKYPQYGIVAFQDLNGKEAGQLSVKTGHPITWGMYVLLQIGGSMQPHSITALLEEGTKVIEGGQ
jgi:hypothetical protein